MRTKHHPNFGLGKPITNSIQTCDAKPVKRNLSLPTNNSKSTWKRMLGRWNFLSKFSLLRQWSLHSFNFWWNQPIHIYGNFHRFPLTIVPWSWGLVSYNEPPVFADVPSSLPHLGLEAGVLKLRLDVSSEALVLSRSSVLWRFNTNTKPIGTHGSFIFKGLFLITHILGPKSFFICLWVLGSKGR